MYQKDLNMSFLLDFYGEAIPERQREALSLYYDEDQSLAEIAEGYGISRQGARHLIKKGEEQLTFLEEKLGLARLHLENVGAMKTLSEKMDALGKALDDPGAQAELLSLFREAKTAMERLELY